MSEGSGSNDEFIVGARVSKHIVSISLMIVVFTDLTEFYTTIVCAILCIRQVEKRIIFVL